MSSHKLYRNCPLKKRPILICDDNDEPKDLTVKRRKECNEYGFENGKILCPKPMYKSTITPEKKLLPPSPPISPMRNVGSILSPNPTNSAFSNPSLQPQPNTIHPESKPSSPYFTKPFPDVYGMNPYFQPFVNSPELYRRLGMEKYLLGVYNSSLVENKQLSSMSPLFKTHLHNSNAVEISRVFPDEIQLSSPRSMSSEDSGVGVESNGDDDVDVLSIDEKYPCHTCGKSFLTQTNLSKHQKTCAVSPGSKSFECKNCNKSYNSLGALKMHIRTHTLPCKCHLCGKAFSRPWLLQGHIRTHTGEKPFKCDQCDRCFADRSNLRAHQQTHVEIKKYPCGHCSKTFSRMSLLNKHLEGTCPKNHANRINNAIKLASDYCSPISTIHC